MLNKYASAALLIRVAGQRTIFDRTTPPAYLKQIERYYAGLRMAGAPEG